MDNWPTWISLSTNHMLKTVCPITSGVAQRKRVGLITQRSKDRNLPPLYQSLAWLSQWETFLVNSYLIKIVKMRSGQCLVCITFYDARFHQMLWNKKISHWPCQAWEWYSGGRFRSFDLWVMSPTRFRCATPLVIGHTVFYIWSVHKV